MHDNFPRYRPDQTYLWNYEHAPDPVEIEAAPFPGNWEFCGLKTGSPLGIPAGPLLNGRWLRYYASLGFDVLTYKTVRSTPRECFPMPNLQPVTTGQLGGSEKNLPASREMHGSWAVSFGMPSMSPEVWRADLEWTKRNLPPGRILSVSVVGTVQPGWSIEDLARDYAQCARWARDSGADCIETNFSCPNVSTCDGQLYQQPASAAIVAAAVREAIGAGTPYILKIGHVTRTEEVDELLQAVAPLVDAIAMTNSVASTVADEKGTLLFGGQPRGICGDATRIASIAQTRLFADAIQRRGLKTRVIGVGGASTAEHVSEYLAAGAEAVHIATAAMVDPAIALRIREQWADGKLSTVHRQNDRRHVGTN